MAALIDQQFHVRPDVVEGSRGEFSVWVGDVRVAQKDANGFPEDRAIVAAVKKALGS